jgi:hypothetical protein
LTNLGTLAYIQCFVKSREKIQGKNIGSRQELQFLAVFLPRRRRESKGVSGGAQTEKGFNHEPHQQHGQP